VIEAWRVDYNTVRPHSSLRYLTPEEFAASVAARDRRLPPRRSFHRPDVERFGRAGAPEC